MGVFPILTHEDESTHIIDIKINLAPCPIAQLKVYLWELPLVQFTAPYHVEKSVTIY